MEVKASFESVCQQETRIQLRERYSVILNLCQAKESCTHTRLSLYNLTAWRTRGACVTQLQISPADPLHPLATRPTARAHSPSKSSSQQLPVRFQHFSSCIHQANSFPSPPSFHLPCPTDVTTSKMYQQISWVILPFMS